VRLTASQNGFGFMELGSWLDSVMGLRYSVICGMANSYRCLLLAKISLTVNGLPDRVHRLVFRIGLESRN
jgi:hypothetical protein